MWPACQYQSVSRANYCFDAITAGFSTGSLRRNRFYDRFVLVTAVGGGLFRFLFLYYRLYTGILQQYATTGRIFYISSNNAIKTAVVVKSSYFK